MAVATPVPTSAFELQTAALTLLAVALKTPDVDACAAALHERFADTPCMFDDDPVAIDLEAVRDAAAPIDLERLIGLLRGHGMRPVAVRGGSAAQTAAARAAGLVEADAAGDRSARSRGAAGAGGAPTPATPAPPAAPVGATTSLPTAAADPPPTRPTQIVDKPLRSGQLVYARGADLIVLAVVSHGAEVIADGHIHVYAPLRGRALAGARGDTAARIFTTCLEPQLISIAGIYRTAETALPEAVLGRPAQVRLDGEKLVVEPLQPD